MYTLAKSDPCPLLCRSAHVHHSNISLTPKIIMHFFKLTEPQTLQEAASLLADPDSGARAIAGGTAVMLMMKTGVFQPDTLVSLRNVEGSYSTIEILPDGNLRIGALTSLRNLEKSNDVMKYSPVIGETLKQLSNVRVRNVATLGGHLAHGDPHLDLPPVLLALDASLTIVGPGGERTLAVADLFESYLETSLNSGELIAHVTVPQQAGRKTAYIKHTTRSADDWPALGIAASLAMNGDTISSARIAIGAATPIPQRLLETEAILQGVRADEKDLDSAANKAADEAEVASDARGSASYKKELIRVFTKRAILKAAGKHQQGAA